MLNREDMLELTRRMTPSRTCFDRIAGCYMDKDGYPDGSFNTNFLKLSRSEMEKNLAIAKAIPFSKTNEELKEYSFTMKNNEQRKIYQLLSEIKESGLKNDAMLETFYEVVGEHYKAEGDYAIYVFHGSYDIPVKGTDKEWLEGSEDVYEFIICAICPVHGDYEAGSPLCGFLFPSFSERSSDTQHIAVFSAESEFLHTELWREVLKY